MAHLLRLFQSEVNTVRMTEEKRDITPEKHESMPEKREVSAEELAEQELTDQEVAELPDRDNMSLINANVAAPINLAAALNVASDHATAIAVADQTAPITQK